MKIASIEGGGLSVALTTLEPKVHALQLDKFFLSN